ncbi:MAG: tetratricopeptide repeat protein [Armatimonadota bacterium]
MTPEAVAIIERTLKALVFVPTIGLVGWWILSGWLDRTLGAEEAFVGMGLLLVAFALGVGSIVRGGWGFLGVIAVVYLALMALAAHEYTYWRRREHDHYVDEVSRYKAAIERDPRNAAAYSFLAQACLRLGRFDEAEAALEIALELDPDSKKDRRLLRLARERRTQYPWTRLD